MDCGLMTVNDSKKDAHGMTLSLQSTTCCLKIDYYKTNRDYGCEVITKILKLKKILRNECWPLCCNIL